MPKKILVIDDDDINQKLIKNVLAAAKFDVVSAENGTRGIATYTSSIGKDPFSLILLDIVMPDMDGKTLFGKISQIRPDIRVLFMSGYTQDVIAHHGILDDGVYFIQKPFSIQAMAAKVREVVMQ